jgi:class 3 adenylate cyclase/tetratricopeptide (TPR) repeat protein
MSFIEKMRRARALLEEEGRVSLRAIQREFDLDDGALDDLIEELVEIQQVAVRDGRALGWAGGVPAAASETREHEHEHAPRNYTPKHLADKILQSKSVLEGERKQVTVLFADVKGSMELAEQFDPEAWHEILDRFFEILSEGVHRFEGTVNQYTGDGIMALFGAPIAHEDHAQRACYAALQLRDEISRYATELKRDHGVGFSTRMGLNSGEVVVGKIGDDLRMDYTAQGHSVGLAQRMESLASPDTCYLTDATASLVQGYFELESLGDFKLKGVGAPVPVHRLVGLGAAHTRFDISRARGLTRFVGRDSDMEMLEDALAQAQAGNGQVVGVVAEAGTGKSRLCFEFVERCRVRGSRVNEGHAVPHGANVPYLPVLEAFRDYYGIEDGDPDRLVREKIAGRMLLIDEGFRDVLPVMFEFFGVPDPDRPVPPLDPEMKQRQLFSVLRRMVQRSGPSGTGENLISLIEDLHWLDAGSEAFLEQWVDAIAGSSALLIVNFRPEYHSDWMKKSYYRQLPLSPLAPEAVRDLLDDLLGRDPSTEGLSEAIHQRTGGNPFFTEEVARSLIESGQLEGTRGAYRLVGTLDTLAVPPSVHGVLAARIDRLGEREKGVLQAAAVIGREFSEPILEAAAEMETSELRGALTELKSAEFIYEQTLYPVAEYAFKHALTQEVALGSQLAGRRRRAHANVARAIEAAHADKLDEQTALLAHHWDEAGEALTSALWHRRAAEWVGRNDAIQGVRHMQRVLTLTDAMDASPEVDGLRLEACRSLLLVGGWRVGLSPDAVEALFAEGLALAESAGDADGAIALHLGYAMVLGFGGDLRGYHSIARKAAALIDDSVSRGSAAISLVMLEYSARCLGPLREALDYGERAVELSADDPAIGVETAGFSVWGTMLQGSAESYTLLGRLDEARSRIAESFDVIRTHDMREPLVWALYVSTRIADYSGDAAPSPQAGEARRNALEAVRIAEASGNHFLHVFAYRSLGVAQLIHADWQDAATSLGEALAVARKHTGLEREGELLAELSRAQLGHGNTGLARATAEESIACSQRRGAAHFECQGQLALARALRADPGRSAADSIEACLDRALELVRESDARVFEPQITEERARLAALCGGGGAASEGLQRAHAAYTEIGATGHAERLARELGL